VNQGLYDDQYFRSGWEFDDSRDSGVMLPVELGYEPRLGAAALPGHYKIGFGYDTSHFNSFHAGLPTPAGVAPPAAHVGNTQVWALADQMLVRNGPGDADGIIGIAGFVHNDPENSVYAEQYTLGLLDHHFWAARPDDTIGLLFSYDSVSGELGRVQGLENDLGLPYGNAATGIQTNEMVFEANYDIHVFRGVSFQPDFQYVIHPNAQTNIADATVFGFKAHVSF
jgi:porin